MKKTLSVFLSFVMLFTCICVGGISVGAAEKKSNIQYLFDRENETLYIRGKGAVPAYYLGWDECKMMTTTICSQNATTIKTMVIYSINRMVKL